MGERGGEGERVERGGGGRGRERMKVWRESLSVNEYICLA